MSILLLSFSFALYQGSLTLDPIEYKNFGAISDPNFTVTLSMDCPSGEITQTTMSGGSAVKGANSYLKYVQYSVPLLTSGTTDSSGKLVHKLPGTVSYYTGLFTLTVEKSGYQKQEVHFGISKCFVNATAPPPVIAPPPNVTPPEPNKTIPDPEPNTTPIVNTTLNVTAPNTTNNDAGNEQPTTGNEEAPLCPLGLIGLIALFAFVIRN